MVACKTLEYFGRMDCRYGFIESGLECWEQLVSLTQVELQLSTNIDFIESVSHILDFVSFLKEHDSISMCHLLKVPPWISEKHKNGRPNIIKH